jgi:arabinose-5-phosphate isomerase
MEVLNTDKLIEQGKRVVEIESQAVQKLKQRIDGNFTKACQLILASEGRVIVIGMGKSGHIGKKIAATLASTGTPAFYVHPAEASHGDLGMITVKDIVLAISHSGETKEILTLIPLIKRLGIPLITMTGNKKSTLSQQAMVNLDTAVEREACALGLAPTSSTTVTLVLGDALAIALLDAKGFSEKDFAFSHPGGSLGRRLLLKIDDLMHTGQQIPIVLADTLIKDALLEITRCRLGFTCVVDEQGKNIGLFTDGDLRRSIDKKVDLSLTPILEVMTTGGRNVHLGLLAAEALRIMQENKINALPVVDENEKPIGALNMHDLLQAGVV